MKLTRADFFKLVGGGAGAAALASTVQAESAPVANTAPVVPDIDVMGLREATQVRLGEELKRQHPHKLCSTDYPYPMCFDVQPWILYDHFTADDLRDPIRRRNIFSQPDTYWDDTRTNLHTQGQLRPPECMAILGLSVLLDSAIPDSDLHDFLRNVAGQIWIGQKIYNQLPMARLATRARFDQLVERGGKPTKFVPENMFVVQLVIESRMPFKYSFVMNSGYRVPDSISGYVLYDGYLARGVS